MKILGNEEYYIKVLDNWLKEKSAAFIEERKKEGAEMTEREELRSRRSFEAGIISGMRIAASMAPKLSDFLSHMEMELFKL